MAGLFSSRKSKNGIGQSGTPETVAPAAQELYEPLAPPAPVGQLPDAIPGIPDLYAVLGVDPRSSDDVIRYAYRKKAAKLLDARWRPGRAARQLAELNAAYEILGKPDRRADYDQQRARLAYYQQASRPGPALLDDDGLAPLPTNGARPSRTASGWARPRAPRGLLEAVAIVGVVIVALYAGYTVLGNRDLVDLGRLQDAGAALGLPIRPRTVATVAPSPAVVVAPTPTPRPVIVPTVAVPTPTRLPAPTAPPAVAGPARATARVSNPNPPRRSEINVVMRVTRDGRPVVGAPVFLVAHYKTVDERFPAGDATVPTNEIGEAMIVFNIGDATAGHPVMVDVIAMVDGQPVQAQTTFLPR